MFLRGCGFLCFVLTNKKGSFLLCDLWFTEQSLLARNMRHLLFCFVVKSLLVGKIAFARFAFCGCPCTLNFVCYLKIQALGISAPARQKHHSLDTDDV